VDKKLTLIEHLDELRSRIIVCLVVFGVSSLIVFPFASAIIRILKLPAVGYIEKLAFFSPEDAFGIHMQVALFCGWLIAMPVIIYEFWQFILPAMEKNVRRRIIFFIIFCSLTFIAGVLFGYFILMPPALKFLLSFGGTELIPVISAQKYFSFFTTIILGCGLIFQMPVLALILTRLKITNARFLRKNYKYAIVIIFIVAAIITPTTDIINLLIFAVPMVFLYEISIWVASFAGTKKADVI
jgi:sec-independent protein translocase protein TatC